MIKKLNRKGFTLVELMAVIVILAIIIAIAVPSYGKIQKDIKENNYNNQIELLKNAGIKYSEDTGRKAFFVEDLVKNGYITGEKDGSYKSTLNDEDMRCYPIKITEEKGLLKATFIKTKYESSSGTSEKCDSDILLGLNDDIIIKRLKNNSNTTYNGWSNEDVKLEISLTGKTEKYKDSIKSIKWTSGFLNEEVKTITADGLGNLYSMDKDLIITAFDNTIINETYKVSITVNDNGNDVVLEADVGVKIDKVPPTISEKSKLSPDITTWSYEKTYKVNAYDNQSGISSLGYAISVDDCSKAEFQSKPNLLITENLSNPKQYYICVKDNAGNISKKTILVDKIDRTEPTCNINIASSKVGNKIPNNDSGLQWYLSDVELTATSNTAGPSGIKMGLTSSSPDSTTKSNSTSIEAGSGNTAQLKILSNKNTTGIKYQCYARTGAGREVWSEKTFAIEKYVNKPVGTPWSDGSQNNVNPINVVISYNTEKPTSDFKLQTCKIFNSSSAAIYSYNTTNNSCEYKATRAAGSTNDTYYVDRCFESNAGNKICSDRLSFVVGGKCSSNFSVYKGSTWISTTACDNPCGGYQQGYYSNLYISSIDNTICPTPPATTQSKYCGGFASNPTYGKWSSCKNGKKKRKVYYLSTYDGVTKCNIQDPETKKCTTPDPTTNEDTYKKSLENSGVACNGDYIPGWAINPTSITLKSNIKLSDYKYYSYELDTSKTDYGLAPRCYIDFTTTGPTWTIADSTDENADDGKILISDLDNYNDLKPKTGNLVLRVLGTATTTTYCSGSTSRCTGKITLYK